MDLHIVLVEPEIPQNTGNIVRTCAAIGAELHLIEPLGFSLSDRYLKRAGLDYWSEVQIATHQSFAEYTTSAENRQVVFTTKRAQIHHSDFAYDERCALVFGKETAGLPPELLIGRESSTLRIPMVSDIRSLNLSNAVAIVAYEALRQYGYPDLR